MNILVTNDDGINVRGLHVLADTLAGLPDARVYVIAPDSQRTAASASMTIFKELKLTKVPTSQFNGVVEAYACSGYPADCVKVGITMFKKRGIKFDMVCSGINHGSNTGIDTLYSGTVSAAKEGSLKGVQSFAFSVCDHEPKYFDAMESIIPQVINQCYGKFPLSVVINVNVPNVPKEEIQGIAITRTQGRRYEEDYIVEKETDEYISMRVDASRFAEWKPTDDNDVSWVFKKYISIAPVQTIVSTDEGLDTLRAMEFKYE